MNKYEMFFFLFALFLKRVVVLQCQILIQKRQFSLILLDQPLVGTLPCAFHQGFPLLHVNAGTVCSQYISHSNLSFYFLPSFGCLISSIVGRLILRTGKKTEGGNKARK